MPSLKQVLAKIRDLKARILKDSISPHYLGSILEEMLGYTWWSDSAGNFEFGTIKAEALDVAQLVFDRYHAVAADTAFTESDVIESVTDNGDGTYTLVFSEQYPGYVTSQVEHNILKGVYTDIPERIPDDGPPYEISDPVAVTSWMNVVSVDPEHNSVVVTLYPDTACPEDSNSLPVANMTVQRHGNSGNPEDPRYACLQEFFYVDARDGRLVKLSGVTRPGYDDTMITASIGRLPEFLSQLDPRISPGDDGVLADTVVARRFITLDDLGRPVVQVVDRGPWRLGDDYFDGSLPNSNGVYERSKTYRSGHGWINNIGGVATMDNAPSWHSPYWTHIEGDTRLDISFREIDSVVDIDDPQCPLSLDAWYMGEDVTDSQAIYYDWTRESIRNGTPDTASDKLWNDTHRNAGPEMLLDADDMNFQFGSPPEQLVITVTATIHDPNNPNLQPQSAQFFLI